MAVWSVFQNHTTLVYTVRLVYFHEENVRPLPALYLAYGAVSHRVCTSGLGIVRPAGVPVSVRDTLWFVGCLYARPCFKPVKTGVLHFSLPGIALWLLRSG